VTIGSEVVTASRPLDAEDLRARVQEALDVFLTRQAGLLDAVSRDLRPMMDAVTDLLRGGKRLRPAFCYWGWRGAGGADSDDVVRVAAALELFQAAALLHDDVMDSSDTRRGLPAAHRRLAALHQRRGWLGPSDSFGVAGAILAGDLCLSWCDELFTGSGLSAAQLARGRPVFDQMRTELMAGQYLDMFESVQATTTVERARHVIRYKSAKYSVQQPLLLGGALAGAPAAVLEAYAGYGLPLGEAFQLRDDVLGVFGDPTETGKPAGDDLREGKRTVLVAATLERSSPAEAATLLRMLGDASLDADGVGLLRGIMTSVGALDVVERMIDDLSAQARVALDRADIDPVARAALDELVVAATARTV
jgi:geranylgeranyl diphosphate synthase, type I